MHSVIIKVMSWEEIILVLQESDSVGEAPE